MRALVWLAPLTLVLVAGCGDPGPAAPDDAAPPSSAVSSTLEPSPTETASDEPTEAPEPEVVDLSGKDLAGFTALDGAVACLFDRYSGAEAVRCDVLDNSWAPPPKPADCPGDWGVAVGLTADGSAGTFLCVSDTVVGIRGSTDGRRELPDGTLARFGDLACLIQDSGVSCYDTTSGEHSIFVTPLTYEVI